MTITCLACGYDKNPKGSEFCDACGAELPTDSPLDPTPSPEVFSEPPKFNPPPQFDSTPSLDSIPLPNSSSTVKSARLITRQGPESKEFPLDGSNVVIGIFDSDTGPVNIDLEGFLGSDTVSRNHAEIYQENGVWKIKDLGSTNGVFIKPPGQSRFGARITTPTMLNSGDEIAIAKIIFLFQGS